MNPLDRELKRRRAFTTRLASIGVVLIVASAGVLVPPVLKHHEFARSAQDELAMNEEMIRLGRDVQRFARGGLAQLEEGEQVLLDLAPLDPLSSSFRRTLKERASSLGINVYSIDVGETQMLPADDDGIVDFATTEVSLTGNAPFHIIPRVIREFVDDRPAGFVRDIVVVRDNDAFPDVGVSMVISYIHSVPEHEDSGDEWEWEEDEG